MTVSLSAEKPQMSEHVHPLVGWVSFLCEHFSTDTDRSCEDATHKQMFLFWTVAHLR